MGVIKEVLANFDPTAFDEEEFVFNAKVDQFAKQRRSVAQSNMRRKVVKKIDDDYYYKVAEREKIEAQEREKKRVKQERTS